MYKSTCTSTIASITRNFDTEPNADTAGNPNANPTTNDARSYFTTHTNLRADYYAHSIANTYRALYRPSFRYAPAPGLHVQYRAAVTFEVGR
jgi:hypothetical protein